ncbi:hypothetical protein F4859DRAFT_367324 [Xylaria cf. heliscus]|nr:hypothetical protein F4859DRAFT_367324 [Xylaria cf. heliscus]
MSPQGRSQFTKILTISLLALAVLAAPDHKATTAPAPAVVDLHPHLDRRQEMSVGSSCEGSEGQWNCMTSSFQRCGSGHWSEVQQCALGTQCSPSGLTYQFHIDFADGYLGAAPLPPSSSPPPSMSGGVCAGGNPVGWWLLSGLGLLALMV